MLPKCRAIRRLMDRPVPWTPSAQNTRFSGRVLAASLAALEDGLVPCGRWPLLVLAGLASLQRDRVRGEGSSAQGRGQAGDELFEESLLSAGGEHAVHRLARIRQPEREQPAADLLTGQPDRHVPEVDLGLDPGPIRLRDERVARPPAGLRPDLTPPVSHVTPDHLVRHLIGAILTDQPIEDPSRGVPLLARRVQIRPQHLIDHRLERIQPSRPRLHLLARLGPRRHQRLATVRWSDPWRPER